MGNRILKVSNLRKTYYYLKKNGWKNAYYAALERILCEKRENYRYEAVSAEELARQRSRSADIDCSFSILVPAYETDEKYLREMIDSVCRQSYEKWELILADASKSGRVKAVADTYSDARIKYFSLPENGGISANTNAALEKAKGDYVGLLDHDDVLTADALYEMAAAIEESKKREVAAWLLYSDEDKGNADLTAFYEPHRKPELNMDLLMSNNYICHFLVMKRDLMQQLGFRSAYDGAQDYDLILRAAGSLLYEGEKDRRQILHIPKVLYHWRCHTSSTAENPESKRYAYEAGKRALEDFMKTRGWKGTVSHTKHLGFYRIEYEGGILNQRTEVGAAGGCLFDRMGHIAGGIYDRNGVCPYQGLNKNFSGYMHRAALAQEAYAVDVRKIQIRREVQDIYEEVFGVPYPGRIFEQKQQEEKLRAQSMEFCQRVWQAGYTVVWTPPQAVQKRERSDTGAHRI